MISFDFTKNRKIIPIIAKPNIAISNTKNMNKYFKCDIFDIQCKYHCG